MVEICALRLKRCWYIFQNGVSQDVTCFTELPAPLEMLKKSQVKDDLCIHHAYEWVAVLLILATAYLRDRVLLTSINRKLALKNSVLPRYMRVVRA